MQSSTFLAWIVRMPLIRRWALMHCFRKENVSEHCHQTAVIAHLLAVIGKRLYQRDLDVNAVATAALYHEISETKLQDLNSKTKYQNPEFTRQYKLLEKMAEEECLNTLPSELREDFSALIIQEAVDPKIHRIVKAADTIAAYIKAKEELRFHNSEFTEVGASYEEKIKALAKELPEVDYFVKTFLDSCWITVDKLAGIDKANEV